jgi:dTDP-4-dehydrorhamnose reductase
MKVLIIGATGLLGKALTREWRGDELIGLSSKDVDIRDEKRVHDLVQELRPDWIVLAAAYTDVDACESHQDMAFAVNRDGAINVAKAAKSSNAKLLFISSDYVFDGRKTRPYETTDERNPQSVYGRTKSEAEIELLRELPDVCIARTSWLFGVGGKSFPDTMLKLAASRPALDVVSDQRGCPTYSVDLARAVVQLCRKGASGIVHVNNAGDCSWFEFAREIMKQAGIAIEVRPTTTGQIARPAPRPAYSVLSATSLHRYGIEMPAWQDALQRYLKERSA